MSPVEKGSIPCPFKKGGVCPIECPNYLAVLLDTEDRAHDVGLTTDSIRVLDATRPGGELLAKMKMVDLSDLALGCLEQGDNAS